MSLRRFVMLASILASLVLGETPHSEPRRKSEGVSSYRLTPTRISGRYSQTPGIREGEIATRGM